MVYLIFHKNRFENPHFSGSWSESCIIKLIPPENSTRPGFGPADHPILITNYDISKHTNENSVYLMTLLFRRQLSDYQCHVCTKCNQGGNFSTFFQLHPCEVVSFYHTNTQITEITSRLSVTAYSLVYPQKFKMSDLGLKNSENQS